MTAALRLWLSFAICLSVQACAQDEPPLQTPDEPPAETVPLPPERPEFSPHKRVVVAKVTADAELTIATETPLLRPGEKLVISLYGSEMFLRSARAHYTISDALGRQVAAASLSVGDLPYAEGKPRQLQIPITGAIAHQHTLALSLSNDEGQKAELQSSFVVAQPFAWEGWLTLISVPPASGDWRPLQDLGVHGGVQYRMHPAIREALRKRHVPFYVENVSRQLLSRYHTERGLWEKTLALMGDPTCRTRYHREPSLCSTAFAEAFARETQRHAEFYASESPLFYSLASEPSTTRLAAAADFDFSPDALSEFQRWLERDVYGTVKALNTAWQTNFATFADVTPMTTDEARLRLKDGKLNFGPWIDFRRFQDQTFAKVLQAGANLMRQQDPQAKVGITGGMGAFAFGGWDWSRLAQALDVVECYDIGSARALWRDLAPGKPAVAAVTVASDAPPDVAEAASALWALALEGGRRGTLLWNHSGAGALLDAEGKPSPALQALGPVLTQLEGPAGALLAQTTRTHDGVALLYSPDSIRLWWLLEADRLHGGDWLKAWGADTAGERRDSLQLRLRESWIKLLEDMGLSWRFISSQQLERNELLNPALKLKTLVLPRAIALSDAEIDCIKKFVAQGGELVADALCGCFDEHGCPRPKPPLDEIFGIDTRGEPFFAQRANPLEVLTPNSAFAERHAIAPSSLKHLPPIFSDIPKLTDARRALLAEYRDSPMVISGPGGWYLNLDLSDYLRWRLHPDRPLAAATRGILQQTAFAARRAQSPIDWSQSQVPEGTQLIWLQLGKDAAAPLVLGLRRNPQARLHELGTEADGNWAFAKPAQISLTLRKPAFVAAVQPFQKDLAQNLAYKIQTTLDPLKPCLFVLHPARPEPPILQMPASAKAGQVVELKSTTAVRVPRVYAVQTHGPDGNKLPHYSLTYAAPDGNFNWRLPLALNDACGPWPITVREVVTGTELQFKLEVDRPEGP